MQATDARPLAGAVRHVDHVPNGHSMFVQLQEPLPGVALFGALVCGGMKMATMQAYFYGDEAEALARDQEHWQRWLGALFPQQEAGAS